MSTRSLIVLDTGTKLHSIYCHSNGYLSYNGRILLHCYNSLERVNKLLALGNMQYIGEFLNSKDAGKSPTERIIENCYRITPGNFNESIKEIIELARILEKNGNDYYKKMICVPFDKEPLEDHSMQVVDKITEIKWGWIDYTYMFDQTSNKWLYRHRNNVDGFQPLTNEVIEN